MAKKAGGTKRGKRGAKKGKAATATADTVAKRVVTLAGQLGRIAGTVQAKAEGWMDSDVVNKPITSVRNTATDVLAQLSGRATTRSTKKPAATARARKRVTKKIVKTRSRGRG